MANKFFGLNKNSYEMPIFMQNYAEDFAARTAISKINEAEEDIRIQYDNGVMSREAFMKHVANVSHGHGVYESRHDMSVWMEKDGMIYRKLDRQREVEAILRQFDGQKDSGNGEEI